MVNEGDKEETGSQGNDDTASITTAKCKAGKRFQVNKSVHYIKIDRVLLESLVIVVNKIPFFNVINSNLYSMC